jgi:hypothetical protein
MTTIDSTGRVIRPPTTNALRGVILRGDNLGPEEIGFVDNSFVVPGV